MRRFRLLISTLLLFNFVSAQVDSNKIFLQNKGLLEYPIQTNIQPGYYNPTGYILEGTPSQNVTFISDTCIMVNYIFDGEVCIVAEIDSMYVVITKFGDYFLTYSNLSKPLVKKGDFIKKGQAIAYLKKDFDERFSVDVYLNKGEKAINAYPWFRKSNNNTPCSNSTNQ